MNNFLYDNLHRMIDISCVKSSSTIEEIDNMINAAKKYKFICAFALPSMTQYLVEKLRDEPSIMVGGTVGFPSGCDTTKSKVFQAQELIGMGCDELDMVINIPMLKAGNLKYVFDDIRAIVDIAGKIPVKAILEVTLLTEEEIINGSKIAVQAGVSYVKTGTGWCAEPTTVEHIKLIRRAVGNKARIKAAGGIRDLNTLIQMAEAGCTRFGIGLASAVSIMEEAKKIQNIL